MTHAPEATPARVGRYVVTGVLGAGAMGTVYLGRDTERDRAVAVKVMDVESASDAVLIESVRHEAATMRAIRDPHCAEVLDVVDEPPILAVVTALVDGSTLRAVLAQAGRLTGPQALGVLRGALLGLIAVHRAGLVHGDVKPANILVDRRGEAILIDFGLTRPAGIPHGAAKVLGSPAYMSPEQARGEDVDARSDVYACGAVLFELLTGRRPYGDATIEETLHSHLSAPVPDPRAAEPTIGDALATVCQTAMAKDPADRYQTAQEFLDALEEAARRRYGAAWLSGAALGGIAAGVIDAEQAGRRGPADHAKSGKRGTSLRRRLIASGAAAAIVAIGAVVALLASTGHGHRLASASLHSPTPTAIAPSVASNAPTSAAAYVPCNTAALTALLAPPFPGDVVRSADAFTLSQFLSSYSLLPARDRVEMPADGFRCGVHRFAQSQLRGETIYLYQVRDLTAAKALLQSDIHDSTSALKGTSFAVPNLPSAYGNQLHETGGSSGSAFWENDVLFPCGHFLAQVGFGYNVPTAPTDAINLATSELATLDGHC